jgi:hypothetical protein
MGEMRNVYKVLIGMPKGKKPKHRWGISWLAGDYYLFKDSGSWNCERYGGRYNGMCSLSSRFEQHCNLLCLECFISACIISFCICSFHCKELSRTVTSISFLHLWCLNVAPYLILCCDTVHYLTLLQCMGQGREWDFLLPASHNCPSSPGDSNHQ